MDESIKAQWVSALRSGEYEQGKSYLCADGKYCCLGVLVHTQDPDSPMLDDRRSNYIWVIEADTFQLSRSTQLKLSHMNDHGKSFEEIADHIEANL